MARHSIPPHSRRIFNSTAARITLASYVPAFPFPTTTSPPPISCLALVLLHSSVAYRLSHCPHLILITIPLLSAPREPSEGGMKTCLPCIPHRPRQAGFVAGTSVAALDSLRSGFPHAAPAGPSPKSSASSTPLACNCPASIGAGRRACRRRAVLLWPGSVFTSARRRWRRWLPRSAGWRGSRLRRG